MSYLSLPLGALVQWWSGFVGGPFSENVVRLWSGGVFRTWRSVAVVDALWLSAPLLSTLKTLLLVYLCLLTFVQYSTCAFCHSPPISGQPHLHLILYNSL